MRGTVFSLLPRVRKSNAERPKQLKPIPATGQPGICLCSAMEPFVEIAEHQLEVLIRRDKRINGCAPRGGRIDSTCATWP